MSRKYEGLLALNTNGLTGSVDDLVQAIGKEMETQGAKLDEVKQIGRRKFAYNARKLDSGHYVNYVFNADADVVAKIDTKLKLNEAVHIQHYRRLA